MQFLDLDNLGLKHPPTRSNADAVIVPFGYEGTVTYGQGTHKGPQALLKASAQVETFDDELLDDIHNQIKIWTEKQQKLPEDPDDACVLLKKIVSGIVVQKKLPVVIGGEHGISYGFAQALNQHYKDVSILVFDSHLDLGDQWSKRDFTHASWLEYSLKLPNIKKAALVGIRNFNKLEYKFWQDNPDKMRVFMSKNRKAWDIKKIVDSLDKNVYLSFDLDCFDSSAMPSTGTPEPGGPMWDDVLPIIKAVAKAKNIVGMDLVELAPIKGLQAPDFLSAKLLAKMILYKFKSNQLN